MPLAVVITGNSQSGAQCVRDLSHFHANGNTQITTRACFRTEEKASPFKGLPGVEIHVGVDAGNPETLHSALKGVDFAVLVTPHVATGFSKDAEMTLNMINAAVEANPKVHIIFVGSWTPTIPHRTIIGERFRPAEELMRKLRAEKNIRFTNLRSGYFHENYVPGIKATMNTMGAVVLPDLHFPSVDPRDMGSVAASIITSPDSGKHDGQEYHISGPERMTPAAVAAIVSAKVGKELKVITPPLEAVLPNLPPFLSELLKAYAEDNNVCPLSTAVEDITGKKARSFKAWVEEFGSAFTASS